MSEYPRQSHRMTRPLILHHNYHCTRSRQCSPRPVFCDVSAAGAPPPFRVGRVVRCVFSAARGDVYPDPGAPPTDSSLTAVPRGQTAAFRATKKQISMRLRSSAGGDSARLGRLERSLITVVVQRSCVVFDWFSPRAAATRRSDRHLII